jgi:non-homologous end joining protein Ku
LGRHFPASKRERVMGLEPYDNGLIGTTLRYQSEVQDARDYSPKFG